MVFHLKKIHPSLEDVASKENKLGKTRTMKKILLFSLSAILMSVNSFAQVTDLGGPLAWKSSFQNSVTVPVQKMQPVDMAAIEAEDAINDQDKSIPWRFGHKHSTSFNLTNSGVWQVTPEGRIWRIELSSPEAMTINLLLGDLFIPQGAQLYLYDKAGTNRVGAYTSRNNNDDKVLGTELVHGDHIVVEYFEPTAVAGQGSLTITDVVHGYRSLARVQQQLAKGLNQSGACNVDVNCPLGDLWRNQIRSVAMIVVNGNGICSGALINNTCNDGTPYFLTADHCLGGGTSSWAFRFNWESPEGTESCATSAQSVDPGPPYDQTANGAVILESGSQADFALLRITNMVVQDAIDWGAYYAGWNSSDVNSNANVSSAIGIHHPSGDVKKICQELQAPYHSTAGGASVWFIDNWDSGVTEPGSSGSPLFDQNGRIIGQLFGGAAACAGTNDNGQYDYYGRFGVSWLLGVSDRLAPPSCGVAPVVLDGFDPNPSTAGISRPVPSIDFYVSPNPSNGSFTISFSGETLVTGTLIVTDISGRIVYSEELTDASSANVALTNVANGSYMVRVSTAQTAMNKTVIVNN